MARKKKELPILEKVKITGVAAEGKAVDNGRNIEAMRTLLG